MESALNAASFQAASTVLGINRPALAAIPTVPAATEAFRNSRRFMFVFILSTP
jgi:hypothetical protein